MTDVHFMNYARLLRYAEKHKIPQVPENRNDLFAVGSVGDLLSWDAIYGAGMVIIYSVLQKRWIIFSSPEDRGITESDGRDLETLINLEDAQERYDEHKILMAAKRAETLAHQFNSNPVKMHDYGRWSAGSNGGVWFDVPVSVIEMQEWLGNFHNGEIADIAGKYYMISSKKGVWFPPIAIKKILRNFVF